MTRRVFILSFFLFLAGANFIFPTRALAQDLAEPVEVQDLEDVDIEIAGAVGDGTEMLRQAINKELALLQKTTGVSDDVITGLAFGLIPLLEAIDKKKADPNNGPVVVLPFSTLPTNILTAIRNAAGQVIEDKAKFKAYTDDLDLRLQLSQQVSIDSFTQTVDAMVGLTSTQWGRVKKLGDELTSQGEISASTFAFPYGAAPPKVIQTKLADILTRQQLGYYKKFSASQPMAFATVGEQTQPREKRKKKLIEELRTVANMKTEQLDAEFKLTDAQKRKLNLVTKNIISKVTDRRLDSEDAYRDYIKAITGGGAEEPPDAESLALAMISTHDLFAAEDDRWTRFVKGTLTDHQSAAWATMIKKRQKAAQQSMAYYVATFMAPNLSMTGKQQQATHKLLCSRLTNSFSKFDLQGYSDILNIPEKDFVAAMGEDNWNQFKPQLDSLRQQMKSENDASKEEE